MMNLKNLSLCLGCNILGTPSFQIFINSLEKRPSAQISSNKHSLCFTQEQGICLLLNKAFVGGRSLVGDKTGSKLNEGDY